MKTTADPLPPERYPLGAPIRPEPPTDVDGDWRALDPDKPWIQTDVRTGRMRNVRPTPPPGAQWWP